MKRNTSTGVEKTPACRLRAQKQRKHLHGRGEDRGGVVVRAAQWETPPRAWRRLTNNIDLSHFHRNTSTGVEKTNNIIHII